MPSNVGVLPNRTRVVNFGINGSEFNPDYSEIESPESGFLMRKALSKQVLMRYYQLTSFRALVLFFLGLNILHHSLVVRYTGDKTLVSCATNSWMTFLFVCVILGGIFAAGLARALAAMPVAVEVVVDVWHILLATILSSAAGPHDWRIQLRGGDVCSSQTNPASSNLFLFSDILGTGALIRLLMLTYLKPPGGYGAIWVVFVLAGGIAIQIGILDQFVVPEISEVWKELEINGTALDSDLDAIGNRLTSLEKLTNFSDY